MIQQKNNFSISNKVYFGYTLSILMLTIMIPIQITDADFNLKRFEPIQVLKDSATLLQTAVEPR